VRRPGRLPIAIVTALAVAQVAVVLMRPRDRGPDPLPVQARAYFTPEQIQRADAFRHGQIWLGLGQMAIGLAALALLVRYPPRRVMAIRRPVLAGAATAATVAVVAGVAPLPLGLVARERAKDVGLVTQDLAGYAADLVKSEVITAVFAGAGGAVLVLAMRRFGRRWWIPGTVAVVAFAVISVYAGPVVLDPLFNKFTPLPKGQLRTEVLDLAKRAGVDVGQVYEMDASRRTTAANAYVNGLGRTKRVVLFDTLVNDFTPAETRLVVAHELGHVHYHDVRDGLLWVVVVAPFGMWAAATLAARLAPRDAPIGPRAIPAVALSLALLLPPITWISNQLSREVEQRADAFALRLTREPRPFIGFQRRIAVQNVSEPEPPDVIQALFGTHPTTLQRIGQGEAFAREQERGTAGR
jgi:STE24 endopeptidase